MQLWRRRRWQRDPQALAAYDGLKPMVVVTGGSEGIGYALARRFAAAGNDLILVARRPEPLEAAAERIRAEFKVEAVAVPADVTAQMPSPPSRRRWRRTGPTPTCWSTVPAWG